MRVLIVNPILYTSETVLVHKTSSIKDTMIYDLCMAFIKKGHSVTLIAAEDYKPFPEEEYPFEVVFFKTRFKWVCFPNSLPWLQGLASFIRSRRDEWDIVIASEAFSLSTFTCTRLVKDKLIVWHELAKHNKILKKLPSIIWYNIIVRAYYKKVLIVPRSIEAKQFISQFCKRVYDEPIDHGVNLDVFVPAREKENSFIVCSQLIERKQIDGIIENFSDFITRTNKKSILYIAGSGDEEDKLHRLVDEKGFTNQVIFLGKLSHELMLPYLAKSLALLVNTRKDNNLLSIVEAIAVCTPIITTSIPYNSSYIIANELGIVDDYWNWKSINEIYENNEKYVSKCNDYRCNLSTEHRVLQFMKVYNSEFKGEVLHV